MPVGPRRAQVADHLAQHVGVERRLGPGRAPRAPLRPLEASCMAPLTRRKAKPPKGTPWDGSKRRAASTRATAPTPMASSAPSGVLRYREAMRRTMVSASRICSSLALMRTPCQDSLTHAPPSGRGDGRCAIPAPAGRRARLGVLGLRVKVCWSGLARGVGDAVLGTGCAAYKPGVATGLVCQCDSFWVERGVVKPGYDVQQPPSRIRVLPISLPHRTYGPCGSGHHGSRWVAVE